MELSLNPENLAPLPEQGPDEPAVSRQKRINALYWDPYREDEIARILTRDFDFGELNRPLVMLTTRGLLDEGDALQEGERGFFIPDEVTCILRDDGIELPDGHKDRPRIAAALSAAMQRGHEAVMRKMESGIGFTVPPDPGPVAVAPDAPTGARLRCPPHSANGRRPSDPAQTQSSITAARSGGLFPSAVISRLATSRASTSKASAIRCSLFQEACRARCRMRLSLRL